MILGKPKHAHGCKCSAAAARLFKTLVFAVASFFLDHRAAWKRGKTTPFAAVEHVENINYFSNFMRGYAL
jgi:hypothetical protein